MTTVLPKRLKNEPLIDAVFEVRFDSEAPVSVVLPGLLFNKLNGEKSIESLPIAQLPISIRKGDPNLKYAPLSRINWDRFFVNIGDNSLSISCKVPYAGWSIFKPAILNVMNELLESRLVKTVERYSLKYVDLIPVPDQKHHVSMVNLEVRIAGHRLEKEPYNIRVEIPKDGMINVIQIISGAKATLNTGIIKEGLVVDVDTVAMLNNIPMKILFEGFTNKLDAIHNTNKVGFFDCLSPSTLKLLEPIYE
jgi:uncharacterized protein (TIGR04255 family)